MGGILFCFPVKNDPYSYRMFAIANLATDVQNPNSHTNAFGYFAKALFEPKSYSYPFLKYVNFVGVKILDGVF